MALTYRGQLDRPLTQEEIDANFAYFTGSHGITGSLGISGSIIPAVGVGQLTSSFSLGSETAAWKDIYVSEGSIKFIKSGSDTVTLSAKDGGISVDGGSVISADGINGQFFTSKSLDTSITVKDSNNSLLMGPIDVETDTEIIVEEGSDLTIFGDIDIQNVATADTALFAFSSSYTNTSSYAPSASFADTASYVTSASYTDTSSYAASASFATTASYVLNSSCSCTPFPYSGSAVITGSLVVNNGTNNIINTSNYQLLDSNGATSIDWESKTLKNGNTISTDWSNRLLQDSSEIQSVDWENRILYANDGTTSHIDWSNPSYMQFPNISGSPITNVLGIDGTGKVYYTASSAVGGGILNSPGGVEGSIQFNNSIGDFGGTQKFTYNASSHSISLTEFQPTPFGITENKGQYSILQGREGKVLGDYGVSLVNAYALNTGSVAIGLGVVASGSYQVAVGQSNVPNNTSSIFIVGVGGGKDGFTVEADASVRAHVTIPVNSTNPTNPKSGSMYVFESGSNYYINVYIGGRWRSASLF